MAVIKIVDLPAVGRDLAATDLFEMSLVGGTGSRKITGQEIMNASKLSVNNTPVINGTAGRIFFQDAANVLQQSSSLFWDGTNNRLGIGTSTPLEQFHMANTGAGANTVLRMSVNPVSVNVITFTDSGGALQGSVLGTGTNFNFGTYRTLQTTVVGGIGGVGLRTGNGANAHISFYSGNASADLSTETMRLVASTGNLLINTTTDAGFKLDVNGTLRVQGNTTINGGTTILASNIVALNLLDTLSTYNWQIRNNGSALSLIGGPTAQFKLFSNGNLLLATNANTDAGYRLDVNGIARFKDSGSAASIIMQYGTGGWIAVSNSGGTEAIRLRGGGGPSYFNTGQNVLIGTTTDAGFLLDVNGTARVTGNFNVSGGQGITTISPNSITGGTDFFVVKTSSLGTFITARENGILFLGPTAGARTISYEALSFSHRSLSSMAFNNGGAWVPTNQLNQAGMYINANYTNAGAGGTSEGAIFQFQGNTATTIGNVTLNQISMKPTYNNTGGTTINRGFFYNPTLTSMTNTTHYAFHSTSGRVRLEGLPTSPTGLSAGDLYNDGGTIKIV
jgi:hypothetical protein